MSVAALRSVASGNPQLPANVKLRLQIAAPCWVIQFASVVWSFPTESREMRLLRQIFTNPWALVGIAGYAASFFLLGHNKTFAPGDAISVLVIFGLIFPFLAWVTTIRARPLNLTIHRNPAEMWLLLACLIGVTLFLVWGSALSEALLPASRVSSGRGKFLLVLTRKLLVFVVIPFLLFRTIFGYRWKDFGVQIAGLRALIGNHLPVVLVLSLAILAFQFFVGSGAAPIRRGEFSATQLAIGLPICFAWLLFEVGLVEEFFFRALLQTRLAAWFRSEVSGVALMALLFGLSHAPGFILRGAGAPDAIGANPTVLDSIAYAIVVLSVSGIFFGIVWARTKNLFAVMFIHASADLLPNFAHFAKTWG
jgi:membrane protease YdiL (CAAX protease family)